MEPFAKETIPVSLEEEMRRSYLDYAMSVIVGRALPDVRDGLKPVHRRVLFAMHEPNNVWNRAYVKCARIVGDVLGKYHPHGDTAIYDALVRMAQDFSHALPAHRRAGQLRLGRRRQRRRPTATPSAAWRASPPSCSPTSTRRRSTSSPNYDGKEHEPTVLPSRVPNLLVNGSSGIAVGMATNIPPHNLGEVVDACLRAAATMPNCAIDELIELDAGARLPDRRHHLRRRRACTRATAPAAAAS